MWRDAHVSSFGFISFNSSHASCIRVVKDVQVWDTSITYVSFASIKYTTTTTNRSNLSPMPYYIEKPILVWKYLQHLYFRRIIGTNELASTFVTFVSEYISIISKSMIYISLPLFHYRDWAKIHFFYSTFTYCSWTSYPDRW